MQRCIVLVIGLSWIESLQRNDFGYDGARENLGLVELRDIGLGDALLFVVGVKDRGAILRAFVGALAIELRGSCATEKNTRSNSP